MMPSRSSPLFGVVIVATGAAMFGMLGSVSRFSYDDGLAPLAFITWRSLVGMLGTGGFAAWRIRRSRGGAARAPIGGRAWLALLSAAVGGFMVNIGMFVAFGRIPVALVLLAFYTYPAMVAVVAVALGREHMDRWRALALGLASLGMVGVVAGQLDTAGAIGFDLLGIGLALLAAVGQTVFVTVSRDGYRAVPTEQAMTFVLAFITAAGAVAAVALGTGDALAFPLTQPGLLGLLVFAGLFTAAIPSLMFLAGIRILGGMRAGILMLIEPMVGVILAALLLGEALRPIQLAGGLAILAAAVLLERAPFTMPFRLRRMAAQDESGESAAVPLGETGGP